MMRIVFNKDWEIENWYETCTKEVTYGLPNGSRFFGLGDIPEEVCEVARNVEEGKEKIFQEIHGTLETFLESEKVQKLMEKAMKKAETRWQEGGERCLAILSRMLEVPQSTFEKEYRACFTFSKRCPFHNNAFMFNRFSDFLEVAMHEIMHIEFLKAYREQCRKLGLNKDQINHLKEILTVLLNEEMGSLFKHPDRGYARHQEMRRQAQALYQHHKQSHSSFQEFLQEAAKLVPKALS